MKRSASELPGGNPGGTAFQRARVVLKMAISLMSLLTLLTPTQIALSQTATTTSISGLVTDSGGAVIPNANVTLKDNAQGQERTSKTNDEGRYVFSNLEAGVYDLTVSVAGFKKANVTQLKADVTKSVTQDFKLEPGVVTEEVTVTAGSETQLQKQDSSVGNTIENKRVALLPNITRDATRLLSLQPGTTPDGAITGARQDQSTFTLDGIDVSDNVIGQTFRTVIPTPAEAIEEFRVSVANPNSTFGRSSGAQVVFITKRGTNQLHGSLYEYHQDRYLSANSWTNNRLGLPRPFFVDNRFGGSVGGPVFKDKTFFFVLYEGRRNPGSATVTRVVPTSTLKQGLLRFRDTSGVIQTINPKTFDPRSLGANAAILQMLAQYPDPNDFTAGDGLNTGGFTSNFGTTLRGDLGIVRIDHTFTDKWTFDGSFKAYRELAVGTGQVDIVRRVGTATSPSRPRTLSAGLTGILTPHISNEFRFGWTADRLAFDRISPFGQVPAANIGLDLAGTLLDEPIDVDTQRARRQARSVNTYQFIDNVTWSRNTHTVQAGFNLRHITSFDFRDDKVIGSISTPVAQLGSATFNTIPAAQRPVTCSATVTQNCLQSADVSRYNQLYASLLGEVEAITYLATRDGSLQPNPIGTGLIAQSKLNAYEMYAADTWRIRPSLTLSYGLLYSWQTPPIEKLGKQTVAVFKDSGELINPKKYLEQKRQAAEQGDIFNPDIAYLPINESGRKYAFNIDRKNFSPRFSVAWNPSFKGGFLGHLMGDGKTVVRGGYSLLYDRINTVQTIIVPTLGVGFAQTLAFNGLKNAAGQPFRAGTDGSLPVPVPTAATSPVVPSKPFGEILSFVVDPFITVPRNHTIDFTVQRTLPGNMVIEFGYVGRLGRNLYQSVNLNNTPYFFKDKVSGQTFAQAYDLLAAQLRAGVTSANVTPQPWFENLLVNLAPSSGSRTKALAATQAANIINGNLSNLFLGALDFLAAKPFDNLQALELFYRVSGGRSDYHGLVTTLRKRFGHGLTIDANYTFSRSLDQIGFVQNAANLVPNAFDLNAEYGPSPFDVTHIFNSSWVYDLPFGQGQRLVNSSHPIVSRLVSGWYTSGIYRAASGFPLSIVQGSQVWGGSQLLGTNSGAIGLPNAVFDTGVNRVVPSSSTVATTGNPANRGSGLNLFPDPVEVFNSVRRLRLSEDTRSGRNALHGLGFWQFDLSIGKATKITERVNFRFSADFINLFNHVNFNDPGTALTAPASFGVISSQKVSDLQNIFPRRIQLGARIEF